MKVAQNFILYNFDYMTKVQFLIDFELQNQSQILTQNPNFWGIIFKAKFGNNSNTNLAPKIVLNNSR